MGLFGSSGGSGRGLFGHVDWSRVGEGLATAQALLDGDYGAAAQMYRRRRDEAAASAPKAEAAAPMVGDVVKGYRFKGGDRNDPKNWEPVEGAPGVEAFTGGWRSPIGAPSSAQSTGRPNR